MRIHAIAAFLSVGKLKCEIFCRGMQQVLFDVDFGYVLRTTAADLILSRTQDELHFFFLAIIFHKNPRLIVAQNLKKCQPPSVTKRLETK